jgi:hypothetical protein
MLATVHSRYMVYIFRSDPVLNAPCIAGMAVCRHKLQRLFECMHWCLTLCAALRKPLNKLADLHTMGSKMHNTDCRVKPSTWLAACCTGVCAQPTGALLLLVLVSSGSSTVILLQLVDWNAPGAPVQLILCFNHASSADLGGCNAR